MKRIVLPCVSLCFLIYTAFGNAQTASSDPGGQAMLEKVCTACHGLEGIMSERHNKARWSAIVDDMVTRGAQGSDEELDRVVNYLAKVRGPAVKVNQATAQELTEGAGLPQATASAIVAYREKNGAFKTVDDLKKVPGADAAVIEENKDRLDFAAGK
jgi:competence protein ComEA